MIDEGIPAGIHWIQTILAAPPKTAPSAKDLEPSDEN
jgi:hypothetical protein